MDATLYNAGLLIIGQAESPQIEAFEHAIRERRRALGREVASSLRVGDTVRLNAHTKPTYLAGLTATVVKVNDRSARIKLHQPEFARRFGMVGDFRCPVSLLERA
jgi:hypothetical protein